MCMEKDFYSSKKFKMAVFELFEVDSYILCYALSRSFRLNKIKKQEVFFLNRNIFFAQDEPN